MLLPIVALSTNIVSGSSDSTMFRGNVQRTGVYDAPGVPELHGVRWKFKTGGRVYSSPAVVGGVAYVGSTDGNLYAIDAATGAEKWRFKTGDDPVIHNQTGIQSSAAVANGIVYFGCRDSKLYALDAATGAKKWAADNKGSWVIGSPAVKDGKLIRSSLPH